MVFMMPRVATGDPLARALSRGKGGGRAGRVLVRHHRSGDLPTHANMLGVTHRTTTIDRTTTLPAAPSMVFAVVNSPETAPLIDPAVREWSADSRPIVVGTRFTIRGRLGVVPIRATSEVVVWDPPRLSEFRSVAPAWPVRMTARHSFEQRSDGGTEYTWSISFEEASVVARPLVAIMRRLFRRALVAQAEALRSYLSQRDAGDPAPPL